MSSSRRALVVDDDRNLTEILQRLLERHGYEVDIVHDGIAVVELSHRYDVILLDLRMPVFDGERLAAYWALTAPEILQRVIILTAHVADKKAIDDLGPFEVVRKPFDLQALLDVMHRCVTQGADALV